MRKNIFNLVGRFVVGVSVVGWLTGGIAQPVVAASLGGEVGEVVFFDDFSQGLAKWDVARGAPSLWVIKNGAAEGSILSPNAIAELVPKPEFWDPTWRNYEFELDMFPVRGIHRNLNWGYQNPLNGYDLHLLLPNSFELSLVKNGTAAWMKQGNFTFLNGQWHHLKVKTTREQLQIWIDGTEIFKSTDPNDMGNVGAIALKVITSTIFPTTVRFDNVQIRLLPDPPGLDLGGPAVRQDDPAWANVIYDKALNWAGEEAATIKRWGCALTSAVMVLRFHGFEELANGQPLTPESLNAWLLSQKDGYIGSGSVNWVAVVRLAKELREKFSTLAHPLPQLAYAYRSWNDWVTGQQIIKTEIDQGRPAILQLPGHFIVARGYNHNLKDILVRDPASGADILADTGKPALSARTFRATIDPELVDLSYWMVVFPKGLRVRVFDGQNNLLKGWWVSEEAPGGFSGGPNDWVVMTLPEPPTGQFRVELSKATGNESEDGAVFPTADVPQLMPFELQLLEYDDEANEVDWRQIGSLNTASETSQEWLFTSGEDGASSNLEFQFGWSDWRTSLREVVGDQKLPKLAVARLDQVAEIAQVTETELVKREQPAEKVAATNRRYATWLSTILDQAGETWPELNESAEITHLRSQLGRWLEEDGEGAGL